MTIPVNCRATTVLLAAVFTTTTGNAYAIDESAESPDLFAATVAPLLEQHCWQCHGPDVQEAELRLDTFAGLAAGGKSGPLVTPNEPDQSLLIAAVEYQDEALQMPPDEQLPAEAVQQLRAWIAAGAAHPGGRLTAGKLPVPFDVSEARSYWAFQPVRRPEVPEIDKSDALTSPIDAFAQHRLQQQQLTANSRAAKQTLIRRATFDLTGLPPTPEEVSQFLEDNSPDALAAVIDRLLESPHYGERWGRHWLDVARYADSNGLDENIAHGNAWRYRDYVIDAFNADKPFNDFMREQIAGDLLVSGQNSPDRNNELLTATGFLTLGPKVLAEGDELKMQMDIIDEQVDTIGRAFLGLTFGCARCHDHKFDPIAQADYYALVGIFKSTRTMESLKRIARWNENSIPTPADQQQLQQHQQSIDQLQSEIDQLVSDTKSQLSQSAGPQPTDVPEDRFPQSVRQQLESLRQQLKELQDSVPDLPTAMGVAEGTVADARINVRGSHLTLGASVSRGIPVVFRDSEPLEIGPDESGRRQLADWLASDSHPLTARVIVNRVWRWHFGRGLVATPDNFGHLGNRPSHPELLDWLAAEFISQGWSLKQLHRTIMLSETWQRGGQPNPAAEQTDPANELLWRSSPRRLEAEEIRDSVLFVAGLLDPTPGGSLLHVENREFIFNHTSKDETSYDSFRRSVYLPVIRNNLYDGFSLFDYTDASVVNGDRATSTVAPQALFMLNSPLFLQSAEKLAEQILNATSDDRQRVDRLYQLTFSRAAEPAEISSTLAIAADLKALLQQTISDPAQLQQAVWTAICQSVLASNEFVYVR